MTRVHVCGINVNIFPHSFYSEKKDRTRDPHIGLGLRVDIVTADRSKWLIPESHVPIQQPEIDNGKHNL